jgi:NAD(P)-dependent dehydrogenase (short-subunit alcohol dehydrogenase family)
MKIDLNGKTMLVTGGTSGIGKAVAQRALEAGAKVAIMSRRAELVADVAGEIGAFGVPGDITRMEDATRAVEAVRERFGGLTTLVNNAGVIGGAGTADTSVEEWERIMSINVDGTVNMCRAAVDAHKAAGGASIVNLSSVTGSRPFAQVTAYCMAKAAVDMYTQCLALELAADQVRVNAIAPGVVVTNLHTVTNAVADYDAFLERGRETHPLGRVGQVDDIASIALFLASDLSSWMTGAIVPVDGGRACLSAR